jgi:hypothetical protein
MGAKTTAPADAAIYPLKFYSPSYPNAKVLVNWEQKQHRDIAWLFDLRRFTISRFENVDMVKRRKSRGAKTTASLGAAICPWKFYALTYPWDKISAIWEQKWHRDTAWTLRLYFSKWRKLTYDVLPYHGRKVVSSRSSRERASSLIRASFMF